MTKGRTSNRYAEKGRKLAYRGLDQRPVSERVVLVSVRELKQSDIFQRNNFVARRWYCQPSRGDWSLLGFGTSSLDASRQVTTLTELARLVFRLKNALFISI